jgi:hypothetical protein
VSPGHRAVERMDGIIRELQQVLDSVLSAMEFEDQGDNVAALDAFSSARGRMGYALCLAGASSCSISISLLEEVCKGLLATYDSRVEVLHPPC